MRRARNHIRSSTGKAIAWRRSAGASVSLLAAWWSGTALAAEPTTTLGQVTVTATRTAQPAYDVPASIDVVSGSAYNGDTLGANLSEGLSAIPGVLARNRQNYAQDEQISVRGFGARSQFGVRGVRLYVDDIPATQPDGQGQVSHFNLGSAERVEVLRGPFSTLYGNSSGGVISLYTADGSDPPQLSVSASGGSYGVYRTNLDARGTAGPFDYNTDYSHFSTDGYRPHSRAQRDSFNGKLNLQAGRAGKLTLVLNYFSSPESQDPLGLTRTQFDANPRQTASVADQFNTRKSVEQIQGGLIYDYTISERQSVRVLGYYGARQVRQFLSIPVSVQSNPANSGGVVNLDSGYGGADARWTWHAPLAGRPLSVVAGLSYDELSQHRRGYANFTGDGSQPDELGQQGVLKRDETNDVYDLDEYLQASWLFAEQWSLLLGVRHSMVQFDSADHFQSNGDDSGNKGYYATTPVGGLLFKLKPWVHLYASYGDGFETPTLNELAYKPDGGLGLNFSLKPSHSNNGELGAKFQLREHTQAQLALFQAVTRDEIVVGPTSNGRNTYVNAPRTRRQGVEASLDTELMPLLKLQLAYTYVDAVVRADYCQDGTTTCLQTPGSTTRVSTGNRIPGVALSDAYAALHWGADSGWHTSLNAQYASTVPANDINTSHAPSYALLGVDGGYTFDLPHWRINTFVRIDNLLDTNYIGSIIVNDSNKRFFEPGSGRAVLAGLSFNWKY
ncbi:TonB-dependent receptor family protein [Nevskia soli]|uniref:TonB-dependent receptor family protein n=1 Tax=Nevskia soli TaxID=418856 RepID=UPI00068D71A0|nr:TonB-dependent receptor [Nevskia soli]